jgi:glyoxylase-like metal-dependent hydrolase (beta-lactamase superfamily II)
MQIDIFDVEHGSCALVTTDNDKHVLIDAGHNSTTGWRPSSYLKSIGVWKIDNLIITNCDRDHASDLPNVVAGFHIDQLTCNPSITEFNLRLLKGQDMSPGIDTLAKLIGGLTTPAPYLDLGGIEFNRFWNIYPKPLDDENNLIFGYFRAAYA